MTGKVVRTAEEVLSRAKYYPEANKWFENGLIHAAWEGQFFNRVFIIFKDGMNWPVTHETFKTIQETYPNLKLEKAPFKIAISE